MRLWVFFAAVALASARPDVSELPGYRHAHPSIHHHGSSSQASKFESGSLEVIPLNLAHVSTTVHRSEEAAVGFGKGQVSYSSGYTDAQYPSVASSYSSGTGNLGSQYYSAGANLGNQYSAGANLGNQFLAGANLGNQYSAGASLGNQFLPGASLGNQYSAGANLGHQYSSGASLEGQYAPGVNLGVQYSTGASLGGQYSSGANLGGQYSSGANLGGQYSSGTQFSSGASYDFAENSGSRIPSGGSDASSGYHQLINDVLSGKYTVGRYTPSAHTTTSQGQKFNIQPNQAPITYRHVYFAEAPAEAPIRPRIHIDGPIQARKHVKVVFIKTPDIEGIADQELTLPQLEEEKTQIYVLSKEHNHQPQIRIKAGNAGTSSRPEIFFLKYRNEAEALKAQQVLRDNAGKGSFTTGAVLADTNLASEGAVGFTGEGASGFTAGKASGNSASGFTGTLSSGLSSGISSVSGSSSSGYTSGLSPALSSGLASNSASSFQSGASNEGTSLASVANLPIKESSHATTGSQGVTTLYGAPILGETSSGGYV